MVEQIGIFPQEYPLVAHDKQQDFSMACCLFSCSFYKTPLRLFYQQPGYLSHVLSLLRQWPMRVGIFRL